MQKLYENICKSLSARMCNHALAMMRPWAEKTGMIDSWQILQRDYRSLTDYFLSGADDPQREDTLNTLVHEAFSLLDELYMRFRLEESTSYEIRMMLQPELRVEQVTTPSLAFRLFWLNRTLGESEWMLYRDWLANPDMLDEAMMAVSGLTLRLLRSFSEEAFSQLLIAAEDLYETPIRERAWVGAILVQARYDYRMRFYPRLEAQLQDLLMLEEGQVFARTAVTCLIRTMGVEWATHVQQLLQESMAPITQRLLRDHPNVNPQEMDSAEMDDLSQTIDESLRQSFSRHQEELAAILREHIDLNYNAMKGLYHTAFFSEPDHFFLPFDVSYLPKDAAGNTPDVPRYPGFDLLCDSDKYAMTVVAIRIPHLSTDLGGPLTEDDINKANEEKGLHDLTTDTDAPDVNKAAPGDSADDMQDVAPADDASQKASKEPKKGNFIFHFENPEEQGQVLCNAYVQQLFRFCTLNPWQLDADMFLPVAHLPETNLFLLLNPTAKDKAITADHYYRCHAFGPAAATYAQVVNRISTPQVHQNFGFCLQKMGRVAEALIAYSHADNSEWVLRQKLFCQTQLAQYDAALDTIALLLAIKPDNTEYLLAKSRCLISMELYAEAMQVLYQIDLLRPANPTVCGHLSWCAFLCDKMEEAEKYQLRIPDDKRTPSDNINYGHVLFVSGRRMEAFSRYQAAKMQCDSLKTFLALFRPDRKFLLEKGLTKGDVYLMEDQLLAV